MKLSIKNLANEADQKFRDEIVSEDENIQRKIGVVATNITTLAPSTIFQPSDKYGLCLAKEKREERVKGDFFGYLFICLHLIRTT